MEEGPPLINKENELGNEMELFDFTCLRRLFTTTSIYYAINAVEGVWLVLQAQAFHMVPEVTIVALKL